MADALRIPLGSIDYLKIPMTTAPAAATTYAVEMSLVPYSQFHAVEADWEDAEWIVGATTPTCRILAPADLALGEYVLRARITASPERPIVEADGLLEVY